VALLAEDEHGEVVAMANLVGEGELAEAALLVQDSMQRKGLGTALLRRLLGMAGPLGLRAIELHMRADNHAMARIIRRVRPQATFDHDGGLTSATLPVRNLVVSG
jgi:GNAT superfamily N-acetyltransferase